jgi:membrane associated rhomboid family serine protease
MIFNMLSNLPQVTKNLLIINVLMLLSTYVFQNQVNLVHMLGAHNFMSPKFEPYQIVTHFFMHGSLTHLFFNMFALVMFGGHLERIWGPMRFFWFYIISAIGALVFYAGYSTWEMYQYKLEILAKPDGQEILSYLNQIIVENKYYETPTMAEHFYVNSGVTPMVGASGAIYGILVAFAMLFPNTELMLLFPPIPIKAKYLVGLLMIISLYFSFVEDKTNIAHLAHLGGGVVGFIILKIWQKDKKKFY